MRGSKESKAPCYDKISNRVLRCCTRKAVVVLPSIINAMLILWNFSKNWKSTRTIPKHVKSDDMPMMGKIAERIIARKIQQ